MTRRRHEQLTEYEPDESTAIQRLKRARADVEKLVTKEMTYGAIARTFPEHRGILTEVLLTSDKLIWNPDAPPPSRVTRRGR